MIAKKNVGATDPVARFDAGVGVPGGMERFRSPWCVRTSMIAKKNVGATDPVARFDAAVGVPQYTEKFRSPLYICR